MADVWLRLYDEPGASVEDLTAGWALWLRKEQQPWPHGEMRVGFQYRICRQLGSRVRKITARATVTRFHDFVEVASLDDAYTHLEPLIQATGMDMSRDDWLSNEHNLDKDAQQRWPRFLAFWAIEVSRIPSVVVTGVKFGQTGWLRVPSSAIEQWGR